MFFDEKGKNIDFYISKYGFCWFEMNEDWVFLFNGELFDFIGINWYQDYFGLVNVLLDQFYCWDMEILKVMGGNFICIVYYL